MAHIQVGDVLRRKRLDAGLTQKELAALADYHHTYVSRVERGEQHPSHRYLTQCIEVLRVPESEQGKLWNLFHTDTAPHTSRRAGQALGEHRDESEVVPSSLVDDQTLNTLLTESTAEADSELVKLGHLLKLSCNKGKKRIREGVGDGH